MSRFLFDNGSDNEDPDEDDDFEDEEDEEDEEDGNMAGRGCLDFLE